MKGKMLACALASAVLTAGAAKLECIDVRSPSMGKDVPVSVLLPNAYFIAWAGRFPVIYMLHGAGGENGYYVTELTRSLVDEYGIIAVCPDGNRESWWLDSPVDPSSRYETFVSQELVAEIDRRYQTRPDRAHRAIMGGSMGGHGACWIGLRHKDVFGAVGNIFGGLELRPHAGKWGLDKVLGDVNANPDVWDKHSVVTIAPGLKNGELELISVVGTEDFFLSCNRKFHDILSKNHVSHEYIEIRGTDHEHSCHSGEFFSLAEPMVFRFLADYFRTGKGLLGGLSR